MNLPNNYKKQLQIQKDKKAKLVKPPNNLVNFLIKKGKRKYCS